MNWLNKLERRFGFIAIPNLVVYVIGLQAMATLAAMRDGGIVEKMLLDPAAVETGEYWRLVTFICVPDTSPMSLIFAIFWFYFLWLMGQALEHAWGAFKLTIYLASGVAFQALLSMLAWKFAGLEIIQAGYYWTLSIQLAFAYLYPEFTMYIFGVLPVKMRWWAWVIGAMMLYKVVTGGGPALLMISASLGNYLLFFGPSYWQSFRSRQSTAQTRAAMQASVSRAMQGMPEKKCQDCQRDSVQADLRLCDCARCGEAGKFWCVEHLPAHLGK